MKADLHMHSHYSDGAFSPADLLQKCKEHGLEVVSLTDHENFSGIAEATEAGRKLNIRVIPGMEFSVDFQGAEHHVLGYFLDYGSSKLKEFLDEWKETKITQIKKIIDNLRRLGFEISLEQVLAVVRGSVDRYHISLAMFPDFEKSAEAKEKQRVFFRKYLLEESAGGEGLAFAEREKPSVQSVISLIKDSGGMAFWAHPFWKGRDQTTIQNLALTFREMGLSGIEAFYPFHTQERTLFLRKIAQDLALYESGGSDFHREDSSIRQIASFQTFGLEINFPFGR